MRSVVVVEPNKVEIRELKNPTPGPYQALVRTDICAMCNSTDAKLVAGHFPGIGLDMYPLVLGHEATGIVVAVGEKVTSFKVGDRLLSGMLFDFETGYSSGWGGFSDYTLSNDFDAMKAAGIADEEHGCFECNEIQNVVPADIGADEAALLCTWREVMGGIDVFGIKPTDRVLIYGGGPVGMSFAKFGRLLGWDWIGLVDVLEWKRHKAMELGATAVFAPDDLAIADNGKYDVIIDAVGKPGIINQAVSMIKMEGKICVYGVLAEDSFTLNKSTGPYNFNLMIHQWPTRKLERASMEPICHWIRQGKLSAAEFVTHRFPVENINDALNAVKSGQVLKCLVDF
ncbi:MAG: alcohol dehydrogenase catalytic domain-containing protein [Thermoguttaceae bacterium]|nr:alcohol dehydrogenase catalytic domain-containing protein [Thermoguttaceae bacterium]